MDENKTEQENEIQTEEIMDMEEAPSQGWLKDNLRIIVSILIVVLIAGGVYSFSKRADAPEENREAGIEIKEDKKADSKVTVEEKTNKSKETVSSAETSKETEQAFVETAGKGDGTTKLARRALANYLEKNPDSSLTAEHKIYIEDYLRKNVGTKQVKVGGSVEFSKDSIQKAIEKSKGLNDKQLKNLHKYAVQVPSLS